MFGLLALQPRADEVVRACGLPGDVHGTVGQVGGELVAGYWRLREDLVNPRLDADLHELRERATALLQYHQWMLHESLHLAFSGAPNPGDDQVRARLDGLGKPAGWLRELRDEVEDQRRCH